MLIAIQDGKRIDAQDYTLGKVYCPECGENVIYRNGVIRCAHFAHKPNTNCTYGRGESEQHIAMKFGIKRWFENRFDLTKSELEWKLGHGIIPDYYCEIQNKKIVVECVYKHRTINEYIRKSGWYYENGYLQLWIFDHDLFLKKKDNYGFVKLDEIMYHCWEDDAQLFTFLPEEQALFFHRLGWKKGVWHKRTLKEYYTSFMDRVNMVFGEFNPIIYNVEREIMEINNEQKQLPVVDTNEIPEPYYVWFDENKPEWTKEEKYNDMYTRSYVEGIYAGLEFNEDKSPKKLVVYEEDVNRMARIHWMDFFKYFIDDFEDGHDCIKFVQKGKYLDVFKLIDDEWVQVNNRQSNSNSFDAEKFLNKLHSKPKEKVKTETVSVPQQEKSENMSHIPVNPLDRLIFEKEYKLDEVNYKIAELEKTSDELQEELEYLKNVKTKSMQGESDDDY